MDSIKKLSEKYPKSYPRLKISGPLIDGKFNVYNGERLPNLSVKTENVKETEIVVNKLIASGADFLKAYEMLSPEQFEIIMKIAKKKKINVTGHIPLSMDIETASNLGLNSLEHIKNLELWATKDKNELLKLRRGMMKNTRNLSGLNFRGMIHNTQKNYAINNLDKDATIKIYLENSVGIGEHPQHIDEIDKQFQKIADAQEKLKAISDFREPRVAL